MTVPGGPDAGCTLTAGGSGASVTLPIFPALYSVNHRFPSGPGANLDTRRPTKRPTKGRAQETTSKLYGPIREPPRCKEQRCTSLATIDEMRGFFVASLLRLLCETTPARSRPLARDHQTFAAVYPVRSLLSLTS
jgi:hypothetical protein